VFLEAQVEMPAPVKGAVYASPARNRAFVEISFPHFPLVEKIQNMSCYGNVGEAVNAIIP
jgi:hypothetical protein